MAKTRVIHRRSKPKYKSKLEVELAKLLPDTAKYEATELSFTKQHKYYPDFTITDTFYIEGKGYFDAEDRAKHLLIKEQHPDKEIVFVFYNSKNKLNKKSKTTYADWCIKHGFRYCDLKDGLPSDWSVVNEHQQSSSDSRGSSTVSRGTNSSRARSSARGRPRKVV